MLVVDDNRSAADALARVLRKAGDRVDVVYDGAAAIERLRGDAPDLLLTDLKMEPVDGLQVLQAARSATPPVEVLVFTAYGAVDTAVKAMRLGARDFLTKPVTVEQLLRRVDAVRAERGVASEPPAVIETEEPQAAPLPKVYPLATLSAASMAFAAALRQLASVDSPVWIEGEVGSGRVSAARQLHALGASPSAPLVVWRHDDLLATPRALPTSGTVVVAAADELTDAAQRELLRRVSASAPGVRWIATAGPDAQRRVGEGRLRSELYFELAVLVLAVPPLRDRPEDIPPLFGAAMAACAERLRLPTPELPASVEAALVAYPWPGNLRELDNLAERSVVSGFSGFRLATRVAEPTALPDFATGFELGAWLDEQERRIIVEALRQADGDRARAGRLLGVERNTFRYKLNKHGLL